MIKTKNKTPYIIGVHINCHTEKKREKIRGVGLRLNPMIKGVIDEWAGERIGKLDLSKRRVYLGGTIFDENII